jgi:hypothetical protein
LIETTREIASSKALGIEKITLPLHLRCANRLIIVLNRRILASLQLELAVLLLLSTNDQHSCDSVDPCLDAKVMIGALTFA